MRRVDGGLAASDERLGRYALIGEPTALKPVYMHKGVTLESIRLRGRSGHASNPRLGNNAIDGLALRVLMAVEEIGEIPRELDKERPKSWSTR